MKKVMMIVMLILVPLLLLAGCEEIEEYPEDDEQIAEPIGEAPEPEVVVTNFEECVAAGNPVMESYPRQCRHGDKTFTEEIDDPVEMPEEECEKECRAIGTRSEGWYDSCTGELIEYALCAPEPFCGDGECGADENCDNCYEDCGCVSPAECDKGNCVTPECGSDNDCDDEDDCTYNKCYFAQHVNAYCGFEKIKSCRDGDGCCPGECTALTDEDCEEECGNDECEPGEDEDDCPEDCADQGPVCGNDECEDGEDALTCQDDCDAECGNGVCEPGEEYLTCPEDCV